jgi:type IV pilus assembly protein PilM
MFSTRKTQSAIGLDLGTEKLNLVQIDRDRNTGLPKVHAALSDYHDANYDALLANPAKMKALIKRSLSKMPFSGRKIISSMPNSRLQIMFLDYVCHQGQREEEALYAAASQRIGKDLSDYVIDYTPIKPTVGEKQERMALIALAKRHDVEAYLDLLKSCGLSVAALEIGPVAIRRLITAMSREESPEKVVAINFGTQKSYLTVIWNGDILLDREMNFGLESILRAIGQTLEIDHKVALKMIHDYGLSQETDIKTLDNLIDEEASLVEDEDIKKIIHNILAPTFAQLATEIREVLLYIASETRGGAVEYIYLLGSVARLRGLDRVIDEYMSIPVKTLNPFYGFATSATMEDFSDLGPLSGIAVATGLALREIH